MIFKDVTKRKKTEEELNEMQYRLTIAKDAAKIGIYDYYISSGRVYWDKRVRDIWGIPEDETVTFEMFLSVLHPDDRKLIDWSIFSPENRNFNVEYRVINKQDGAIRWVKATGTFFFEGTQPIRLIGTIEDISSRKNLEQKIKDQERLSAIGATAGMVGHDIRNPLQAVLSDTYLIKDELASMPEGENKEGVAESIDSIERNIAYINKIVQDLQDYARQIVPEYSVVDLSDVFVHVIETISIPESINFSINVKDVGKIRIDPSLVQRAITNLVNNAIQAMPNGGKLEICGEKKILELLLQYLIRAIGHT